jgi:Transposase IS116/IS110/IS902 family
LGRSLPGNNESAGKHKSGKTRRGDRWLRSALTEAALAAIRPTRSAFGARYRRIMRHRGHKKAIIAVAHALLVTAYHLMARGVAGHEEVRNFGPATADHEVGLGRAAFRVSSAARRR